MTSTRLADILRNPTAVRVIKLALAALVVAGLARHVQRTSADLDARGLTLRFDPGWLAAAAGLYLAGLAAQGAYFGRVLARGPTPIGAFAALRAYLVSHLAKYVPGKAMVVVVRSALAAEAGARPAAAAFATLYETLVMMAAGGLLAALLFAAAPAGRGVPSDLADADERATTHILTIPALGEGVGLVLPGRVPARALMIPALGAGVGLLALVLPRTFPGLAGLLRKPLKGVGADTLPRLSAGLLAEGIGWASLGWTLLGLSQVAVIVGVGVRGAAPYGFGPAEWPAVVASVALATVAGFAIPIAPGGLGVREWVLWTALGTMIDRDRAVVAALVLRLVWVAAEVVAAAALLPIRAKARAAA